MVVLMFALRARVRADRGRAARLLPGRRADPGRGAAALVLSHPDLLRARSTIPFVKHARRSSAPCCNGSTRWRPSSRPCARSSTTEPRPTWAAWSTWCSPPCWPWRLGDADLPADAGRAGGGLMSTGGLSLRPGEIVLRGRLALVQHPRRQRRHAQGPAAGTPRRRARRPCPPWPGSTSRSRPASGSASWAATAPGRPRRCGSWPGSSRCSPARSAAEGWWSALLEFAAGFSRDFSGRENIYLQGALYGLDKRGHRRADRSDHRVLRARRVHRHPREDLLDAACSFGSGSRSSPTSTPTSCCIDEVLAVGDEAFQRKCLRRISEQIAAGRHGRARLPRRERDRARLRAGGGDGCGPGGLRWSDRRGAVLLPQPARDRGRYGAAGDRARGRDGQGPRGAGRDARAGRLLRERGVRARGARSPADTRRKLLEWALVEPDLQPGPLHAPLRRPDHGVQAPAGAGWSSSTAPS